MSDETITSLLRQLDALGQDLGTDGSLEAQKRSKLRLAARQLMFVLEEPGDVVERVCFKVCTWYFLLL